MSALAEKTLTVEQYLEFEQTAELRHEFVDGQLIAMAGETLTHDDIVLNIVEALRPIARAKKCKLQCHQYSDSSPRHPVSLPRHCDYL